MTTPTTDFCDYYNIAWFGINLTINGTKKELNPINHKLYDGKRPNLHDFSDSDLIKARQHLFKTQPQLFTHLCINTEKYHHIDIDTSDYEVAFDNIAHDAPWFSSMTKSYGKHILCVYDGFSPSSSRMQFINNDKPEGVELLCGGGSYAPLFINNADRPFYDLGRNDFKVKLNLPPQSPTSVVPTQLSASPINADKMLELGGIIKMDHINSYHDWLKIVWSLRSESEQYKEVAREISKRSKTKYENEGFEKAWDDYKPGCVSLGTFHHYCKTSNEKKYRAIIEKYTPRPDLKLASTDLEAANILFGELKDVLKSYNGRIFYYEKNIWICNDSVEDKLLGYVMNSNIKTKGVREGTYMPFVEEYNQAKNVLKTLLIKIKIENNDPDLYRKFHSTTKAKLCFNDGVLDLMGRTFTKWEDVPRFSIYSTVKINRDFGDILKNPPKEAMEKLKQQLFAPKYGNNEYLFYMFLSRAIAGHNEDKRWATYLGNRNCGKGVEYDLLKAAFGDYISTFELGNLLYCRKTAGMENVDCSKKLYWLMDLEFVRLAVSQEIPDTKSGLIVNGKQLKKITGGGDEIVARRNYDRYDTHFFTDFTPYIQGNYTLSCDSPDCEQTLVEFFSTVEYISQHEYDKKPENEKGRRYRVADPTIKEKCLTDEWINAMIYMVFLHYGNVSVPIIREATSDQINLPEVLEETFEITGHPDDIISCADVCAALPDYDKRKIEMELSLKNVHKKKYQKNGVLKNKWVFIGIKNRIIEVEE